MFTFISQSEKTPLHSDLRVAFEFIRCSVKMVNDYLPIAPTVKAKHIKPIKHMLFQFSSDTQSCPTLCDPMNRSTQGLPVHNQLPEFTQIHVHPVSDAIQPSHPLSSPSPPAPNPSQHQSLFQ